MSIEFDHDAGYAIVKIDWADGFAPANWRYWTEKAALVIGVGNLGGVLYEEPEIVSPTTAVIRYTLLDNALKEEADAI